jgi:2-oxoglutarate dehydrogenase E2 component (dihydrolipoamide succinyltransferase)
MSEEVKITLPKLGESILTATVVQWFKKVGDEIKLDEPLLEVSTDKVNSEIPSPVAGVLQQILANPDQELEVGAPLAVIVKGASAISSSEAPTTVAFEARAETASSSEMKDFFSPALLRAAREQGISLDELERIPTTGAGGRLSKKDLEVYLEKRKPAQRPCPLGQPKAMMASGADVERVKMTGMRKAIADNMVKSFYQAPHATLVAEVDVTEAIRTIQKEKETFAAKHGAKLTITSFTARAIAAALQEFPLINSSLDQDTILVKRYVNLGIAVSVDQGLLVPVIKNCQRLTLPEIAKAVGELSVKARTGKLTPDDVQDGTITMTNFGMSGVHIGIPIIRYPEVAIVGMGAVHKKVVAFEDDSFGVRSMMNICLTFDHRVLDGMYGCSFLGALKKHLETPLEI